MLDLVVAPATPHDGELGSDHPGIARRRDLAFEPRTSVTRHVAAARKAVHIDDGRRDCPQIGRDAPHETDGEGCPFGGGWPLVGGQPGQAVTALTALLTALTSVGFFGAFAFSASIRAPMS